MTQDTLHENRLPNDNVNTYATNFVTPDFGEDSLLYSEDDFKTMGEAAIRALQIKQVATGYRNFNLQGPKWYNFEFSVYVVVPVEKAIVSTSLLGIFNQDRAVNMKYYFEKTNVVQYSPDRTIVYVSGRVYIGDSDGYLRQLSYNMTCI